MPVSEILVSAGLIANQWRFLAIVWHFVVVALIGTALAGWRPSPRTLGRVFLAPLVSVGALAGLAGNPFNAVVFGVAAVVLAVLTASLPTSPLAATSAPLVRAGGVLLFSLGWVYPHFLNADTWAEYLYAAPLGLLPCPTLSMLIGVTLVLRPIATWSSCVMTALGLFYGAVGVFRLGVELDYGLLAGSLVLAGVMTGHLMTTRFTGMSFLRVKSWAHR